MMVHAGPGTVTDCVQVLYADSLRRRTIEGLDGCLSDCAASAAMNFGREASVGPPL